MSNVLTLAETAVAEVSAITGQSEQDWKTLYNARKTTLQWDMDLAAIFGKVVSSQKKEAEGEDVPLEKDQSHAFGVWIGTMLAGEPKDAFWPETYLVGLDYALSGYGSRFLFAMANRIEESFFKRCMESFDNETAQGVYLAFKRIFGVAISVMVDCSAYAVSVGTQKVGINEKLFERIRNQAIESQVEEARQLLPLIEWNDSLSVGIESIDTQHKKLVELLNRLHDSSVSQKGSDTLKEILSELVNYTKTHFAYEEKLMAEHDYSSSESHIASHVALAKQVIDFNESFQAGKSKLSGDLFNFLRKWLNGHIRGTDRQYAEHFIKNGVK